MNETIMQDFQTWLAKMYQTPPKDRGSSWYAEYNEGLLIESRKLQKVPMSVIRARQHGAV